MTETFDTPVRRAIDALGGQAVAARKLNVGARTVGDWLAAGRVPKPRMAEAIARLLLDRFGVEVVRADDLIADPTAPR